MLLVIQTVKADYRGFKLANTNIYTRNLQVVVFTQAGFPSSVPVPVWLPLTGRQHALLSLCCELFWFFFLSHPDANRRPAEIIQMCNNMCEYCTAQLTAKSASFCLSQQTVLGKA